MSRQVHAPDEWPLFDFCVSLLDGEVSRLHISIDLLIGDGRSFEIVFQELMQLYRDPGGRASAARAFFPRLSAGAYVPRTDRRVSRVARVLEQTRADDAASPELPLEKSPASITRPVFKRRSAALDPRPGRN